MRIRIGFAVTLALVVVLALGSTGTSAAPAAAPSENAVVYWSGIAEVAIAAGRPPASSTVLAAMVHGAMYDAVAAVEGGLEPFATGVTAPPEASADAAVAQAARDVLVARVPGQATAVQSPTTPSWRRSRPAPRRTAARPLAPPPPRACSRCGPAITSTTSFRTSSRRRDLGVFEPIAPTPPVDVKLRQGAAVHVRLAVRVPAGRAVRADEQALRAGRQRAEGVRRRRQRPDAVPDRARPLLLRSGVRPVQPCRPRCGRRARARPG